MVNTDLQNSNEKQKGEVRLRIVWPNAIGLFSLHIAAVYGLYVSIVSAKLMTWIYGIFMFIVTGAGVTVGAHRFYTHRCFKATFLTRCFLMAIFTLSGENCMYIWARDHRQHHKFSDTDADPHNSTRGFFFSHVGWLMMRKHPEVIEKGKTVDLSDLEADPIVMFQKKYYYPLYCLAVVTTMSVPCLLWKESLSVSFWGFYILRSVMVYNCSWFVNSAAHHYGTRPYSGKVQAMENNFVSALTYGEGWHNYHHTFPSDYKASEYGQKHDFGTTVINFMHRKGWIYDLKETPQHIVNNWARKSGDGTHPLSSENESYSNTKSVLITTDISNIGDEISREI